MIIEDTRQQAGKHEHIERWMREHGVEFAVRGSALPFGDYMVEGSNVSIDTKQSVQELAMDLGRDHKRFVRELVRARDEGYRLVILIEEHAAYNDRSKLYEWLPRPCVSCRRCNPRRKDSKCSRFRCKPMQGAALAQQMDTLEKKYGVKFEFCRRRDAARRICELLGVAYDEPYAQRDRTGGC